MGYGSKISLKITYIHLKITHIGLKIKHVYRSSKTGLKVTGAIYSSKSKLGGQVY